MGAHSERNNRNYFVIQKNSVVYPVAVTIRISTGALNEVTAIMSESRKTEIHGSKETRGLDPCEIASAFRHLTMQSSSRAPTIVNHELPFASMRD